LQLHSSKKRDQSAEGRTTHSCKRNLKESLKLLQCGSSKADNTLGKKKWVNRQLRSGLKGGIERVWTGTTANLTDEGKEEQKKSGR